MLAEEWQWRSRKSLRSGGDRVRSKRSEFIRRILAWYKHNRRGFPWRNTTDPFKILLSELLLRKTTARQVAKLYESFVQKYPTPSSLLDAPLQDLMCDLRSLGIYRLRAMQLKSIAKALMQKYGGHVPNSRDALLALPGIGDYIANAVLCLAYGADIPFLDTNSARVLHRVFGVSPAGGLPQNDPRIWRLAARLIPNGKAKDFNLALLDLGALLCTARRPLCNRCPLARLCNYAKKRLSHRRPSSV
jgi:A/G-specific adenine glycosylase